MPGNEPRLAEDLEIALIHLSGPDRPGLAVQIMAVLAEANVDVLDVNQTVVFKTMMMGVLIRFPFRSGSSSMVRNLLFTTFQLELHVDIKSVPRSDYEDWVGRQGKPTWILTIVARKLKASYLSGVSEIVAKHNLNITIVTRLSGRAPLEHSSAASTKRACLEMRLRGDLGDEAKLRADLLKLCTAVPIDISWQKDDIYRRYRRLACFDMDSTLIQCEVIDELAAEAGVKDQVCLASSQPHHWSLGGWNPLHG
eukprot:NODE_1366_length_989_cov_114.752128_g280_i1.p1 GENE.NODE_1366_length_989_cov_114.752128_g280_i1~~NODE_1366_length_989_cov_114.752128_g280_i1.p1  ORF type:complete len:253 (-),score=61.59 NODE_1366_length_989_cov_114.752128_g280_i1:160-918(-)